MKEKTKKFDYFGTLSDMTLYASEAARLFRSVLSDRKTENFEKSRERMTALKGKCDRRQRELTSALVRDFLPPFDKEDLFRLSLQTEALIDKTKDVFDCLYMTDIGTLCQDVGNFAALMVESFGICVDLSKELRHYRKSEKLNGLFGSLKDLKNRGDVLYTEVMRVLFRDARTTREIAEGRVLYFAFRACFDAAAAFGDDVRTIILKNI